MRRCCVSKARPDHEALLGSGGGAADSAGGLAAELRGLKLSQIRKRAEALGIAAAEIDEATAFLTSLGVDVIC